jgi:glutamine synthetase
LNRQQHFISTVYDALLEQEVSIELLHAESAPGQMELVLEYTTDPVDIADQVVLARETIRAVAIQDNMKAVFLPKPFKDRAGNGCHIHMSLLDATTKQNIFGERNLVDSDLPLPTMGRDALSPRGQQFMEGILSHLPSIIAVTMPTSNSFKRVGPGCWTGSQSAWAMDDKEAPVRVIVDDPNTRFEFKLCDSTSNIYMALSVVIEAGLDGILKECTLRPQKSEAIGTELPESVMESLFLLEHNEVLRSIFSSSLMKGYLSIRRAEAMHTSKSSIDDFTLLNALAKA